MYRAYGFHPLSGGTFTKISLCISLFQWNRQKATIRFKAPCVVRTAEKLTRVTCAINRYLGAFMGAAIVENFHLAIGMAHHDHRLVTHLRSDVITLVRGLAVMADKDPSVCKEVLHLKLVNLFADIGIAVHLIGLH